MNKRPKILRSLAGALRCQDIRFASAGGRVAPESSAREAMAVAGAGSEIHRSSSHLHGRVHHEILHILFAGGCGKRPVIVEEPGIHPGFATEGEGDQHSRIVWVWV